MNKLLHYLLAMAAMLAVSTMSASELTSGSLTLLTPDGEMTFDVPQTGFTTQDFTSMGAADELVVKSFSVTASGTVSGVVLDASVYPQDSQSGEWMEFQLTDEGNGTWSAELDADFVEIFGAGAYTLEFYAKALDADGKTTIRLDNGGQNYKIMFALGEKVNAVTWLDNRAAEIWLNTSESSLEYRFNGDGTRNNETMPGATDMLAVNYFSMYYNLAEGVSITDASLQYMIYPEGETSGNWNTISCNELSTLISSRKNTYRSSFNTAQLLTYGLQPGNYTLRVMFQLIDNNGKYHFLGKNNDNFLFHFSINEPADPAITGISMTISPTPGEKEFLWMEDFEEYESIYLEEPMEACSVDEVYIFYEGAPTDIKLCCMLQDTQGGELYRKEILTQPNAWGSASTEDPTEILDPEMLTQGESYTIIFWAEAIAPDGSTIYMNNDGDGFDVHFVYGTAGTGVIGDVSGDGKVDVSDVNDVINIILEINDASDYPGNADLTGDGKVDVSDVNEIINIILSN